MTELKACPFCGSDDSWIVENVSWDDDSNDVLLKVQSLIGGMNG